MSNNYEDKQKRRKERLEAAARRAQGNSDALYERQSKMASVIPMGQPILVGHHSEGADRRYRKRINDTMRRSIEEQERAHQLQARANAVGTGGVSSDDPEAVQKLNAQLVELEAAQELMRKSNAAIRKGKTQEEKVQALIALGHPQLIAEKLIQKDFVGRIGYADYKLTNNSANIRRIKQRIEALQKKEQRKPFTFEGPGFTCHSDEQENRLCIKFDDGKPAANVREIVKKRGFKWSPTRDAWVRMWNNAAQYAVTEIAEQLQRLQNK